MGKVSPLVLGTKEGEASGSLPESMFEAAVNGEIYPGDWDSSEERRWRRPFLTMTSTGLLVVSLRYCRDVLLEGSLPAGLAGLERPPLFLRAPDHARREGNETLLTRRTATGLMWSPAGMFISITVISRPGTTGFASSRARTAKKREKLKKP